MKVEYYINWICLNGGTCFPETQHHVVQVLCGPAFLPLALVCI